MSEEQKPKPRLDQRLTEEAQEHIKSLLAEFPELRSVAIVYDYEMPDAGSLPVGTWLPARKLNPIEYLSVGQACDRLSFSLRYEYDKAQAEFHRQLSEKVDNTKQLQKASNEKINADTESAKTNVDEENKNNEEK